MNDYGGFDNVNSRIFRPGTFNGFVAWTDSLIFNPTTVAFGNTVPFGGSVPTLNYLFPSSPQSRAPNSQLPYNLRDGQANNAQIVKAQYMHNIGSTAYLRLYGYTFYSD